MNTRRYRILVALCGILGVIALGVYYAVPVPLPPDNATATQVSEFANRYHDTSLLDAWLQATGSLLSVVFFVAIVHMAGAATRMAGMVTLLASAVLLAMGLIEGALAIDTVQATANGHPESALTSFDLTGVFVHVFTIAPAPAVFLALGTVLLGARLLPRLFGYLALALGVAFEILGFAGLFSATAVTGVIFLLIGQEIWIVAAAITLVVRKQPAGVVRIEEQTTLRKH